MALYNGKPAIGIDVRRTKGYSTTTVADRVKAARRAVAATLPAGAKLDIVRDAGERVENSVNNVEEALMVGALLTVLVVFLFLNSWRSTVITGLALPVSVLASFIAVKAFGFTLNTMSLLGLSLAIGILIDDAIVVRENIVRHIEMGEDHYNASRKARTRSVWPWRLPPSRSSPCSFRLAFMYGEAGQWFKPFALTIACAVLVSLVRVVSHSTRCCRLIGRIHRPKQHERKNPIARALDRLNKWFDHQAVNYKRVIAWALDHRLAMVLIAAFSFFGALFLQATMGGFGFVPISDQSEMIISVETAPGSSLSYTRVKAEEVAQLVRAHKEVRYTYTTIGARSMFGGGCARRGQHLRTAACTRQSAT